MNSLKHTYSKRTKTIFIIAFITLSGLVSLNKMFKFTYAADRSSHPVANVLLITNNTINDDNALWVSLGLDVKINTTTFLNPAASDGNASADLTTLDFANIDVVVVDSYLPEGNDLKYLMNNINGTTKNTGLIFFGGNYTESAILEFSDLLPIEFVIDKPVLNETLWDFYQNQTGYGDIPIGDYFEYVYNETEPYETRSNEIQVSVSDKQDSLHDDQKSMYIKRIAWQSCPLLYERILTYNSKIDDGALTLVEVPNTKEPLVSKWTYPSNPDTEVLYISPGTADLHKWDDEEGEYVLDEWNTPFHLWPYFNYMMYLMVFDVANIAGFGEDSIETYAQWPHSPIPHETEAIIWMTFVASLWVFNFVLFFTLGKKKRKDDLEGEEKKEKGGEDRDTGDIEKPEAAEKDADQMDEDKKPSNSEKSADDEKTKDVQDV
ncbi:MAG: hypothetical protein GF364_05675 [Candidatus Lokiarchaeota archaeon]|nr:hypothetical protein [Candidatus Lokiarchaeota archaeon]